MADKGWDLTSTNSLASAVEWIRKKSDALMVLVIRVDDEAISADPRLPSADMNQLLAQHVPELLEKLKQHRLEELRKAEKRAAKHA